MKSNPWLTVLVGTALAAQVGAAEIADDFADSRIRMETRLSSSLGGVLDNDINPLVAESSAGANLASARYAGGKLRGLATIGDAYGDTVFASASLAVSFTNRSARVATLGLGKLTLTLDADFRRAFGTGAADGAVGHTLTATLGAVIVDASDQVRYQGVGNLAYQYADQQADGDPADVRLTPDYQGGFSAQPVFDGDKLSAVISAPVLVLQPGDSVAIFGSVVGTATAFGFFGGSGYSATTDFGNTAQLSLTLPPGFGLQSAVPLDWVTLTPVPEPAPALLLAAGLAVLAWRRRVSGRA